MSVGASLSHEELLTSLSYVAKEAQFARLDHVLDDGFIRGVELLGHEAAPLSDDLVRLRKEATDDVEKDFLDTMIKEVTTSPASTPP